MSRDLGERVIGKTAYGLLFVLLWPALLAAWAFRLDQSALVTWPVPLAVPVAASALVGGIILIAAAMRALWVHGGGLPMNAFPPRRLVEQSAYRLFTHPIYLGHALAIFGAAALANSPAGF
jgi:protein-S-isoprenylcysteine O-methyltransferase Ste14